MTGPIHEHEHLDTEQIKVLTAFAEIVIGPDVLERVPDLIDKIDDAVGALSSGARNELDRGLHYLGSDLFMGFLQIVSGIDVEFESFDELSAVERGRFIDALKRSDDADLRALYVSVTGLVTTAFYSGFATGRWSPGAHAETERSLRPRRRASRPFYGDPPVD